MCMYTRFVYSYGVDHVLYAKCVWITLLPTADITKLGVINMAFMALQLTKLNFVERRAFYIARIEFFFHFSVLILMTKCEIVSPYKLILPSFILGQWAIKSPKIINIIIIAAHRIIPF
jgi:hypothetical protein